MVKKKTLQVLDSWLVFWSSIGFLTLVTTIHFWPASYWMTVAEVNAGPAKQHESVPMAVRRDVKRPFVGYWQVTLRKFSLGGWETVCYASGVANYQVGSNLPDVVTFGWWSGHQCAPLDAGRYVIDTNWRILGTRLLPDKEINKTSNIFEITL